MVLILMLRGQQGGPCAYGTHLRCKELLVSVIEILAREPPSLLVLTSLTTS